MLGDIPGFLSAYCNMFDWNLEDMITCSVDKFGHSSPDPSYSLSHNHHILSLHFMPSYDASARKQLYKTQGYVIIPALISPSLLIELEAACARTIAKTRDGTWSHRRTVGRQFPPYDDGNPDSWGVQHVMHPDLGEDAFARWYTSDELVAVVCELMGCGEEDLQMGEPKVCDLLARNNPR